MTVLDACRVGLMILLVVAAAPGTVMASDARPTADERCVSKCDDASDSCMSKADSESKAQQCDDDYSECLEKCR